MFKVLVVVLSLASGQPVGFAVSQNQWPTLKECSDHMVDAVTETQREVKSNKVSFKAKCVDAKVLDKLLARSEDKRMRQAPNSISFQDEGVER